MKKSSKEDLNKDVLKIVEQFIMYFEEVDKKEDSSKEAKEW